MVPSTVLLIDRDQDSLAIYSLILQHYGYDVVTVRDGETGLRLAAELDPDIVISEMFLPPIQGQSLLQGLRADVRMANKPLILLDSIPMFSEKLVDGWSRTSRLTKPCAPTRLVEEVARLLEAATA